MKNERLTLIAHLLILAGLFLLAVWPLHPAVISWGYNRAGERTLSRALDTPGLSPEARQAEAIEAGYTFQEALAWDPLNARAYANLARVYATWGDAASAARALTRAAALAPNNAEWRSQRDQMLKVNAP